MPSFSIAKGFSQRYLVKMVDEKATFQVSSGFNHPLKKPLVIFKQIT